MTAEGQALLEEYPPFLRNDQTIQAVCQALGGEMVTYEEMHQAMLNCIFPAATLLVNSPTAHLAIYEEMLNVPGDPTRTPAQRQITILAALSRLAISDTGADWVANASLILNSTSWSYSLGGTNNSVITITIPALASGEAALTAATLLRAITPASLSITVTNGAGFNLDVDLLDVGVL